MAGQPVQVGSGFIRVIAKTLPEDYQEFKRKWQQGLEQALTGLNLSSPVISNQTATQQGTQAGNQMGQSMGQAVQNQVQQAAPQVTAPIANQGDSLGKKLGIGIAAGVIAAKTGELIIKGLGTAMEAESVGNKLQAQLGLSDSDAAKYQQTIKDLYGGAYVSSMDEASNAVGAVISSIDGMRGASNEAVGDMTKKVLTMSSAFEIDAARSTQVVGQLIRNGMVKDAEEGLDLLTKSFQTMPANVREDLLDNFDEYSGHLKALGYEGRDAFNLMVNASKGGAIMLDKSNDGLKEFMILATDQSEQTMETYKALGLNGEEMTGKLLAGGPAAKEAFQQITQELSKIENDAKLSNLSKTLFGTPLEDLGLQETRTFINGLTGVNDALGETKGAADKATEAMNKGLASSMQGVKQSMEIALGDIALPLLQAILPVVQDLAKWIGENKDLIIQWGGPLLIIGTVVGTIVAAISAFQVVAGFLVPLIGALTAAQWTWNASLFASPLFLWTVIIGGVILAIILLATHWEEVTQFFIDSINWIVEAFQNLGNMFGDFFGSWGELFGGGMNASLNVSGGMMGVPKFANGGLIPATNGGTFFGIGGEAGQNEIVMNEGLYNQQSQETINLLNQVNNGGSIGGNTQINQFPNANPREIMSAITGTWKLQNGF
jgi:phage-related minor tail protein